VKKKILFVATLAVGVVVGVIAVRLIVSLVGQPFLVHTSPPDKWIETEETMLARMHDFQERLDQLEKVRPDNVEAISKQVEAQGGIEDLLTKFREAQQAKVAPFIGSFTSVIVAFIGGIGTTWIGVVAARRNSKKLQTGAGR
jgi:hypothetical protein